MIKGSIEEQLEGIRELLRNLNLNKQEYLSLEEAAAYLKVSKSTLYKHTSSGNIAHYKPNGKLILFSRKDLDEWLSQKRIPSNGELQKGN